MGGMSHVTFRLLSFGVEGWTNLTPLNFQHYSHRFHGSYLGFLKCVDYDIYSNTLQYSEETEFLIRCDYWLEELR
jgi:hypothetical protein